MPLTATAAKEAKPKEKPYKLSDEKGMFLLVNPSGSKYWRLKYRFGGKEKTLALGVYPEVSLAEARAAVQPQPAFTLLMFKTPVPIFLKVNVCLRTSF